jgi:predicted adenylyl cyclase CyaB
MPSNIEFKARLQDAAFAHATATRLSGVPPEILHQTDFFFSCHDGRLKLRMFGQGVGELIFYQRVDSAGPRRSDYQIARTGDAEVLLAILHRTLQCVGKVSKIRTVYLVGQTRIHIDQVEGLGDFVEVEVVLRPDQSDREGHQIAKEFLNEFRIPEEQLLSKAYIDLLEVLSTECAGCSSIEKAATGRGRLLGEE